MREQLQRGLIGWMIGLGLVSVASAASAQPCCECRCPSNNVPACSEDFGLDEAAYRTAVCELLGCSIAVCSDKACAQANRCPRSEAGSCADGVDNDADRAIDCDDPDCSGNAACLGGPSPTPPPDDTPGVGTPTALPTLTPTPTPSPTSTPTPTITKTPADTRSPVATRTPGGCASTGECPGILICSRTGQCVDPRSTPGGNGGGDGEGEGGGGGCVLQPPSGGHGTCLLLPGLLWAIVRRRRILDVAGGAARRSRA